LGALRSLDETEANWQHLVAGRPDSASIAIGDADNNAWDRHLLTESMAEQHLLPINFIPTCLL
jgi:hypothetical protein